MYYLIHNEPISKINPTVQIPPNACSITILPTSDGNIRIVYLIPTSKPRES